MSVSQNSNNPHASLNETYGLNSNWHATLEFFDKNNTLLDLINLINVFQIHSKFAWLGTVFEFLLKPNVQEQLENWAGESLNAKSLLNVTYTLLLDEHKLLKYKSLPDEQAASTQVRGDLGTYFLFAMILERMPPTQKIYQDWFDDLRLWLLIQSLVRAQTENYQDDYIKFTADKIRLASEKLDEWFGLVKILKPNTNEFSTISSYLSFQTDRLISKDEGLSPSHKLFLKQLKFVATGQQKPSNNPVLSPIKIIKAPNIKIKLPDAEFTQQTSSIDAPQSNNEEGLTTSVVDVDPEKSLGRQTLSTNSVIMQSIMDAQFLPWRWNNLNSYEHTQIDIKVQKSFYEKKENISLIGCYTWLGLKTGRTIRRVTDFQIDNRPHPEWTLSHDCSKLFRLPPHRKSDWKPTLKEEINLVLPLAQYIKIELPHQIQELLRIRLRLLPNAQSLGELWVETWDKPEIAFNEFVNYELPRITSSMLESELASYCFANTMDEAISHLTLSHPQSGLSAACAYANFTLLDANKTSSNWPILPDAESATLHSNLVLFGSRLDVVEEHLVNTIKQWDMQYEEYTKKESFVDRHNAFVAYIVLMLMAATAIRNVRDPFESILYFDFEHHFVFVDDKVLNHQGSGRLVPLPATLSKYIRETYLSHLDYLSKTLIHVNPELCGEIQATLNFKPTGKLPFFFFLSAKGLLDWQSVSGAAINELGIFKFVLPFNMFRHRLAKDLRRRDVSPEIVAGILGHADAGSEPYSDFSHRVWHDDAMHVKQAINASFISLPFQFKKFDRTPHDIPNLKIKESAHDVRQFGAAARKKARYKQVKEVLKLARYDFENFLNGIAIDSLNDEQFDQLSKKMMFHDNGIPRTYGYLRYEYLIRKVERLWHKQGKKVKIKRRYVSTRATSLFSPEAPISLSTVKQLRVMVSELFQTLNLKKTNKTELQALIPIVLMLESRFCDIKAILQFLKCKSFRTIRLNDQYHLEFTNREYFNENTPIRRIKISESIVYLLAQIQDTKKQWQQPKEIPQSLEEVSNFLKNQSEQINTYFDLLNSIANFVNQVNCIKLEGIRAGYLSGRVESYALNSFDWIKLRTGEKVVLPPLSIDNSNTENSQAIHKNIKIISNGNDETSFEIKQTQVFFKELRNILNNYSEGDSQVSKTIRDTMISRITALNKEKAIVVSSSILMVGAWIVHLLEKKIRKEDYLRISSIKRYLSTLSPYFTDIAFNQDIFALDEEDITVLYDEILRACTIHSRAYLGNRLIDFDEFASTQNVESPDWSELPLEKLSAKVAPAIMTNDEYHQALHLILKSTFKLPISNDATCMVLLLCYRFGLRGKEALGLLQSDLIHSDNSWIVLVQNNKYRKLKNKWSRRQVPLLFNLLNIEEEILSRHLAQCKSVFGRQDNVPLFFEQQLSLTKSEMKLVQNTINEFIKAVTNNKKTTLHHCRHTAINRIALACIDEKLDGWKGRGLSVANGTKKSLLYTDDVTRRTSWATASYLGHVVRETQYRNYIHFLPDWCDLVYQPLPIILPKPSTKNLIEVNKLPEMKTIEYGLISVTPLQHVKVGALEVFKYFRLLAYGRVPDDALAALNISKEDGKRLNDVLKALFIGLSEKNVCAVDIFKMIKESAWTRIQTYLEKIDAKKEHGIHGCLSRGKLSLEEIEYTIGNTRQIMLWKKTHFSLFSGFLNYFKIEPQAFRLVLANKAGKDIIKFANIMVKNNLYQQIEFAGNDYQLDAVFRNGNLTLSKAAIISVKNNTLPIRNSYEMTMMFAIFVFLVMK